MMIKLTKSQKDFMGSNYHDEYAPEEYGEDDNFLDEEFYDD